MTGIIAIDGEILTHKYLYIQIGNVFNTDRTSKLHEVSTSQKNNLRGFWKSSAGKLAMVECRWWFHFLDVYPYMRR